MIIHGINYFINLLLLLTQFSRINKICHDCNIIYYGTPATILISTLRSISYWSQSWWIHWFHPPSFLSQQPHMNFFELILNPFEERWTRRSVRSCTFEFESFSNHYHHHTSHHHHYHLFIFKHLFKEADTTTFVFKHTRT